MSVPKTRVLVLAGALLVAGFLAGRACAPSSPTSTAEADVARAKASSPEAATVWTCSMHPQVRLPEPGQCPICFMDLIPADSGEAGAAPILSMSAEAAALAEIETAPVERRSVAREVRMVGKIALDETRVASITSWVPGRLERLFVDYTGVSVRADDHLVEIYSPTLYSAQQELLQAIATAERLADSSLDILRTTSDQTVVSTRAKLRLYGLSDDQIAEIVERGTPSERVTLRAPIGGIVVHKNALEGMYVDEGTPIYTIADLSKVWVLLDAYELDLAWLRYGQDVEFSVQAYPDETFHGRVAFIDPLLDDRTRTVKVRLNVDNADGRLKPDMFVSAVAKAVLTRHGKVVDEDLAGKWMCPMHPEVVADAEGTCSECGMDLVTAAELGFVAEPETGQSLVVPYTAPLITGRRAVVYVRVPDAQEPTFEGREVVLGPRAGDWYVGREGLSAGEEVVVEGNFKIDSELQIRALPSMMSLPPAETSDGGTATAPALAGVPAAFREALGRVVDAYVALQVELAADRDGGAAAEALVAALDDVDGTALEGSAAEAWDERRGPLADAARVVADAAPLDARRAGLFALTTRLAETLGSFGYTTAEGPVALFHCPMARDGDGADWLQRGGEVANPYFGDAMLRCGSRVAAVPEGD